ncbi:MAG: acyltransferase domain-containing protein, partial [Planctomycetaceae bacterium]|nr:acyltransferase domain-containing protein [Planctomycetaceae bacterium]
MSRIAFLFPGQGAQHVGMGKTIVEKYPAARELFERAAEILQYDLAKLCFEGPSEELDSTVISQPALFVTSLAALEMLRADSPDKVLACEMAAGLSLGEYTALVFAGAMSFEDGLRVVQRRGEAMQAAADANPSGMVSILLLDREKVAEICQAASSAGRIWIANYLCPGNIVLSGENSACERAAELAEQDGGRAIPLAVAGAFHTEIMKPADSSLSEALAGVGLKKPEIPVISNVDAEIHEDP